MDGRVQGVWFRGACEEQAAALGVCGWARNLSDGRVEVVAEGEAEAVAALERWCHHGPPAAVVTSVEGYDVEPEGRGAFRVR